MAEEKRLIDANILESWIDGGIQGAEDVNGIAPIVSLYDVLIALDNIPTVDAVGVVRCKDCKYFNGESCSNSQWWGDDYTTWVKEEDFCSYGERRTDNA